MEQISLTDEEIEEIHLDDEDEEDEYFYEHRLTKAQLKKVVEWLQTWLLNTDAEGLKFIVTDDVALKTWQSLLEEVE